MPPLTARYEWIDESYWVRVVELPGCVSYGRTLAELRRNLVDAIDLYLEGMRKDAEQTGSEAGTIEFDLVPV